VVELLRFSARPDLQVLVLLAKFFTE